MAKKKFFKSIKLQIPAGKATPAPPIGPALGSAGLNIMAFCKDFNAKTSGLIGIIIPVVITVYADKTYTFIMKKPPTSELIKTALGISKGSSVPHRDKVGKLEEIQVKKIAEEKMEDFQANSLKAAMSCVEGTARSMGVSIAKGG
ncbi:MAG: 50S ribosomal protein L11 [Chlamydiales bacterium]